jgi:hypothetical protein
MQIKRTIIASAAALTLVGSVTGVAVASSKGSVAPKPATTETTSGPDTDNLQQGDQTTPDTTGGAASETTGESAGEGTGESSGESDGPGGHADPAGNVDHQFDGQE